MNASDFLPVEFNVASWFVDRPVAEGRGRAPAFHCEDRVLTYADVQDLVNRTGNALRELGVEMEHRVLVLCLDTPEFLGAFWGAIKIGAIPVPVNTLMRAADYRYFLDDSRARVAVVSAPLLAEAIPALQGSSHLRHVLVAGGAPGSHLSFEDRVARAIPALEAAPTSRDDVAFWLYSSGSTGRPKGAVHLQHDMVVSAETYAKQVLGLRSTDKVYSAAKLFFAYGLGNAGYFPMSVGAESVLYPHRPTPDVVFDAPHAPSAHDLLRRPDPLRRHACGEGRRTPVRPLLPPTVRVRRRGTAGGPLPALAGALRGGDRRRHRHHRERPHLPLEPAGRSPSGVVGDRPSPATSAPSSTTRDVRCRRERSGISVSAATRRWPTTGTSTRRRRRRCSAPGSRRATSITGTRRATSGTTDAATTC